MTSDDLRQIQAIFENGVFQPLGEVALPDHLCVVLRIENGDASTFNDETEAVARQKRAMAELDAELEALPDKSPDDGLSSADHDRILYAVGRDLLFDQLAGGKNIVSDLDASRVIRRQHQIIEVSAP